MCAAVFAYPAAELIGLGFTAAGLAAVGVVNWLTNSSTVYVDARVRDHIENKKKNMCCCEGPSGKPKLHFIMKKSRKEAEEAALHYGNANGVVHHASNTHDNYPHFHPTRDGKKIPGVHFQYPG